MPESNPSSDGQTDATFGATRAQHLAAADGLHPGAEAVGARAFDHGRLVCTFHWIILEVSCEKSLVLERFLRRPVNQFRRQSTLHHLLSTVAAPRCSAHHSDVSRAWVLWITQPH